jgi:hypothetical protein
MYRIVLLALCLISIPAAALDDFPLPEPTQNPDAAFRIFRTQNIFMLLKLDTRTGQIWQVQWGNDDDHRFTAVINRTVLIPAGTVEHPTLLKPGRFTLSPTWNIHTFILLDEKDGRTWQVEWGDATHRFILAIP